MNELTLSDCNPPSYISHILRRLNEEGYDAYIVGGCVRDIIMGRPVHDWDVTTSARPEDVARIFQKTVPTGVRYGTVSIIIPEDTVEVTSFRSDGEYSDGRRPDNIKLIASLDEDLSRRDFTMNAMAVSAAGDIIDPFGGIEDIKKRIIRCVGIPDLRFGEDALRMFRAFRFAAELRFAIESETLSAIYSNAARAKLISAERIRIELEKTILSQKPEIAGEMIIAGLFADKFGIRNTEIGIQERDVRNAECRMQNAELERWGNHYLISCLQWIANLPSEPMLRWCAFCAVLADSGLIQSCADFLRGLRMDKKTVRCCAAGVNIAYDFVNNNRALVFRIPNSEFRIHIKRLLSKHGIDAVRCAAAAVDTLFRGKGPGDRGQETEVTRGQKNRLMGSLLTITDDVIASGECFSLRELSVSGHDLMELGYEPGPELSILLSKLLDHVIDHPEDNDRDVLLNILRQ